MNKRCNIKIISKIYRSVTHHVTSVNFHSFGRQKEDATGGQIALIIVKLVSFIFVIIAVNALRTVSTSNELLDVIKTLFPFLFLLLNPILRHYFGQRSTTDDEQEK